MSDDNNAPGTPEHAGSTFGNSGDASNGGYQAPIAPPPQYQAPATAGPYGLGSAPGTGNSPDPQWSAAADPGGDAQSWRAAYLKARKQVRILTITTVVAAVLAVGLGTWGVVQASSSPSVASDRFGGPGGLPGGGQGRAGFITRMFNSDGSINQDEVDRFEQRLGSGGGPGLQGFETAIQSAVESGTITQQQADQLLAALGVQPAPSASDSGAPSGI